MKPQEEIIAKALMSTPDVAAQPYRAARVIIAALDRAGYEVRPKAANPPGRSEDTP